MQYGITCNENMKMPLEIQRRKDLSRNEKENLIT